MSQQNAFPLSWPNNRPRTTHRTHSPFGDHSIDGGSRELERELTLLGVVRGFILSTNVPLRRDGLPRSDRPAPADPGVAVYFDLKGKPIVMACDKWSHVEDNLWAIVKHIEAIRGTARWGCGEIQQAFGGYAALPPPADMRPWYEVLGVREDCTLEQARAAWIAGAKKCHPDNGGNTQAMAIVNGAWARAQEVIGK